MLSITSVGPTGIKADYSNYGVEQASVAAPGGFFRDFVGTPDFQTPGNLVLSSYPLEAAIAFARIRALAGLSGFRTRPGSASPDSALSSPASRAWRASASATSPPRRR